LVDSDPLAVLAKHEIMEWRLQENAQDRRPGEEEEKKLKKSAGAFVPRESLFLHRKTMGV
jgi:hypothetical protein